MEELNHDAGNSFQIKWTASNSEVFQAALDFLGREASLASRGSSSIKDKELLIKTSSGRVIAKFRSTENMNETIWKRIENYEESSDTFIKEIPDRQYFFEVDRYYESDYERWEAACNYLGDEANNANYDFSILGDRELMIFNNEDVVIAEFTLRHRNDDKEVWRRINLDKKYGSSKIPKGLKKAFKRRQLDTGWWYVILGANLPFVLFTGIPISVEAPYIGLIVLIPICVDVFYAVTRRTITPLLYRQIGNYIISKISAITFQGMGLLILYWLLKLCVLALPKLGINKARTYAKYRLTGLADYYQMPAINSLKKSSFVDNKLLASIYEFTEEVILVPAGNMFKGMKRLVSKRKTNIAQIEQKINELELMLERGIISKEEYKAMRKKILGI